MVEEGLKSGDVGRSGRLTQSPNAAAGELHALTELSMDAIVGTQFLETTIKSGQVLLLPMTIWNVRGNEITLV